MAVEARTFQQGLTAGDGIDEGPWDADVDAQVSVQLVLFSVD